MNDPFPYFEFLSQSQLGQMFGVSSLEMGRTLTALGLRRGSQPTERAERDGLVKVVTAGDVTFPAWHKERMVALLEQSGHKSKEQSAPMDGDPCPTLVGPFTLRGNGPDGDGYEIVGSDGKVALWCVEEPMPNSRPTC